jgi:hypothetical protein
VRLYPFEFGGVGEGDYSFIREGWGMKEERRKRGRWMVGIRGWEMVVEFENGRAYND